MPVTTLPFIDNLQGSTSHATSLVSARNNSGTTFFASIVSPKGGVDTQYATIYRLSPTNQLSIVKRYFARDSREYLQKNGAGDSEDNGKYGNITLEVRGTDLIVGFTIRIDGSQSSFYLVEPNLGI